jgi:flagellar basal body-associated protein FliL
MYPNPNMNIQENRPPYAEFLVVLYHTLLVIVMVLVLFLGGVTIYALVFRESGARPWYTIPGTPALPHTKPETYSEQTEDSMFTGIGRLRTVTADDPPVTVVISLAFPYSPEDWAFAEELASKVPDFRDAAKGYFSAHTAKELRQENEGFIKTEILRRYNDMLQLGKIKTLYFNDFMLID